uniref:Uncharacterized protein n=1 Tax=Podoviridae sp. ctxqo3 TaxID=2827755 RepID=A0A8S5T0B1_9CAUD|nr:MAG TPA: hypothetical protein [Podoviridae sp. ctxqo3]
MNLHLENLFECNPGAVLINLYRELIFSFRGLIQMYKTFNVHFI